MSNPTEFTASDVLLKAASTIEEKGMWCQFALTEEETDRGTPGCAMHHIYLAAAELTGESYNPFHAMPEHIYVKEGPLALSVLNDRRGWSTSDDLIFDACQSFIDKHGIELDWSNDSSGMTAHRMAELMRQAAL